MDNDYTIRKQYCKTQMDCMRDAEAAENRQYEMQMSYRRMLMETGQYKPTEEEAERDRQRWREASRREAELVKAGKKWARSAESFNQFQHYD